MRGSAWFLIALTLLAAISAACVRRPAGTDGQPGVPNACTAYGRPDIGLADPTFRGQHAFDYMIGLVCDHSGPSPRERARVPGTTNHSAGAAYLAGAFKQAGLSASFQNFTGQQYLFIMDNYPSGYGYYLNEPYCRDEDKLRAQELRFANVEGRLGSTGGIMLFIAHWDSKRFAEGSQRPVLGANDGASGVGVLLELARVLAKSPPAWEYRFLFTDGEDGFEDCHPLAGSTFYAHNLPAADRARMRSIVVLDMVGDRNATFYKGCGSDTSTAERIWSVASELDVEQFRPQSTCSVTDDHTPFEERNMKTVDVIDAGRTSTFFPSYWHTEADTPDKLDANFMGEVGRVMRETIRRTPLAG